MSQKFKYYPLMAYTQKHLDELQKSIASGVLSITVDGRTTSFRSLQHMLSIEAMIKNELAAESSSTSRMYPRYQVPSFADD
jgi:hypothetical protein